MTARAVFTTALRLLSFAAIMLASPGEAAVLPPRLLEGSDCSIGGCHADKRATEHVHFDDLRNRCQDCHLQNGTAHEFSVDQSPALCQDCHADQVAAGSKEIFVHGALEETCVGCHDPHGGDQPAILRGNDERELCTSCHDQGTLLSGKHRHGPVASGNCLACHEPHRSRHRALLKADGDELCAMCHEQKLADITSESHRHEAACPDCHASHAGDHEPLLIDSGDALCVRCHEEVASTWEHSPVDHRVNGPAPGCTSCHSPHASSQPSLLLATQLDLCLGCHQQGVKDGHTTPLAGIGAVMQANRYWHGPLQEGNCTGCHQPHGSENFSLLAGTYPDRFYAPFDIEDYGLCFNCHDPGMVNAPTTETATLFRDADRNLHFVHSRREPRGHTCRACHATHASNNPFHISDSVPYGKWDMPLNFIPSANGGACSPGCHNLREYKRDAE